VDTDAFVMQGDRITAPGLPEEKFEKIGGCLLQVIPAKALPSPDDNLKHSDDMEVSVECYNGSAICRRVRGLSSVCNGSTPYALCECML
jgi:hypothetical protein